MSRRPAAPDDRPGVVLRSDGERGREVPGAGTLAMAIFLASLSMLFVASLFGYVLIRMRADAWRPPGTEMPWVGLGVGTVLLVACSWTIQSALGSIRTGNERGLRRGLIVTGLLSIAFVAFQSWNWTHVLDEETLYRHSLYGFTFLMLTGLHALHVLGGLIGLGVVTLFTFKGKYSRAHYPGVRNITMYWHFLTVVWLLLLAALLIGN